MNKPIVFPGGCDHRKVNIHSLWAHEGVTSFYTGIVSWVLEAGKLKFRIVPSESQKYQIIQIKFPGGDNEQDYALPAESASREWQEEVRKMYSGVFLPSNKLEMIYHRDLADEKRAGGLHRKSFWLFPETCLPNYRNARVHFRAKDVLDGDDILHPTELVNVEDLVNGDSDNLYKLYKTHLHALAVAILRIVELAKEVDNEDAVYEALPAGILEWAKLPEHVVRGRPVYFTPSSN